MVLEFWVMRVLLHPGPMKRPMTLRNVDEATHRAVMVHVQANELTTLPDGCIAEPVAQYPSQSEAHAEREKYAHDDPTGDYRVVLNSSLLVHS